MKKATLQAAGTAVLGVAAVTAVAGPAAADPLGGLGQVSSLTGSASSLTSTAGGLHDVTSTAQGVINNAAPTVQGATGSLPIATRAVQQAVPQSVVPQSVLPQSVAPRSVAPQQRDGGLPAVGGTLGSLPALGNLPTGHALDALHQNLPLKPPSIS
ncbi:hypothetical protein [Streptacidiphilus jiangxiensis]|uniref:GLTT repeat-containing protein n=1 Tax=Streptacidiphilus jiangxiensis TaxID=235985 RepID=A0A1H7MDQ8_STRJI|nr:hypothetical protein [Streptacidiphilus jiangxiensis]SEL09460.1 hypothetical protein SAMN05414137_105333 [Streptacidiphilus jiangxiensis]